MKFDQNLDQRSASDLVVFLLILCSVQIYSHISLSHVISHHLLRCPSSGNKGNWIATTIKLSRVFIDKRTAYPYLTYAGNAN